MGNRNRPFSYNTSIFGYPTYIIQDNGGITNVIYVLHMGFNYTGINIFKIRVHVLANTRSKTRALVETRGVLRGGRLGVQPPPH